jgi:hypothetical protein
MEVGEPVCIATPNDPPDVEFEAIIKSITFNGNATVARGNAAVQGPHWEAGEESELEDTWDWAANLNLPKQGYSKKAAAYYGSPDYTLDVKIEVTRSVNVSGDATLIGAFAGVEIRGTCPTSAGEHTVQAKFGTVPKGIQALGGAIGWGLEVPSASQTYGLGSTLAEVYFLLDKPTVPHLNPGVWVEVLRFLCKKVALTNLKEAEAIGVAVTRYCHTAHGLRYDTLQGGTWYQSGPLGTGAFALRNYILKARPRCNCYDQAAAINALCGAVGAVIGWYYLTPYGYIKNTNLVGVGSCNNPFFDSNGSQPVVSPDDPLRTAFGRHSFCSAPSGKILDACAGPHGATETPAQYLAASIDDAGGAPPPRKPGAPRGAITLYERLYGTAFRPGTVADLATGGGVTGILW